MSQVLANGQIFDGTGALPYRADLLMEGELIVEIGQNLRGDSRIDLQGSTLLPGLIDCHVHATLSGSDAAAHDEPFSLQFFEAQRNLEKTLGLGITTVRDASGADLGVKTAVERGLVDGPEILISISLLSQTGGHGDHWSPGTGPREELPPHPGRPSSIVDGPDQMRLRVRELLRAGADVIKVCATGGVLSTRDDPRHAQFSPIELAVCVEEAAKNGVDVMAHAAGAAGILLAVEAGVRSIEHGIFADEECFTAMRENDVWLVPTLLAPISVLEAADAGGVFAEKVLSKARMVREVHERQIAAAVEADVKIAFGTDSGVGPHGDNLRELTLMESVGMSPADVLVAATSGAAEMLRLSDRGVIAAGRLADIVVMDGDPYDLRTFQERLQRVIRRGRTAREYQSAPTEGQS